MRLSTSHDQLGFFLFLALALHLMLILGISFRPQAEQYVAPALEVTLVLQRGAAAPQRARFVAAAHQAGAPEAPALRAAPLSSPPPAVREPERATAQDLDTSIARLESRLDQQQREYSQQPRTRRLTAALQSSEAEWLQNWRQRVETIGNRNYPEASSRYGIYGALRLLVAIRHDGSIEDIEILRSSGHAVLDEAAIRILHLAAPFAAFPAELREQAERVEIVRTWKFQQNRLSSAPG